jgi:hypothetical protein
VNVVFQDEGAVDIARPPGWKARRTVGLPAPPGCVVQPSALNGATYDIDGGQAPSRALRSGVFPPIPA